MIHPNPWDPEKARHQPKVTQQVGAQVNARTQSLSPAPSPHLSQCVLQLGHLWLAWPSEVSHRGKSWEEKDRKKDGVKEGPTPNPARLPPKLGRGFCRPGLGSLNYPPMLRRTDSNERVTGHPRVVGTALPHLARGVRMRLHSAGREGG